MSTVQQRQEPAARPGDPLPPLIAVLRPHQWLKNLLVFVPAVAAHRIEWNTGRSAMLAFVSLCLCASGGYIVNDLFDVEADRGHPRKRFRPLASGRLSVKSAIALIVIMWSIGVAIGTVALPAAFVWTLAIYIAGTISYSIWLKREPSLDVVVLHSVAQYLTPQQLDGLRRRLGEVDARVDDDHVNGLLREPGRRFADQETGL